MFGTLLIMVLQLRRRYIRRCTGNVKAGIASDNLVIKRVGLATEGAVLVLSTHS
jgi:hypothetical protein